MARAMAGLPTANLAQLQEAAIKKVQASKNERKLPLLVSARYGLLRVRMLAGEERSLEPDYRQMISELTEMLGPRNEHTLLAMHGLAHIYSKQERWEECQRLAMRVRTGLVALLGPEHIQSVNASNSYGVCLMGDGKFEQARQQFLQSLAGLNKQDDIKANFVRAAVQINLGHVYAELGKWDDLEVLIPQIRQSGAKLIKADSDAMGEVELIEGRYVSARGDIEKAKFMLRSGIANLAKKNPPDYWVIRMGQRELSKIERSNSAVGTD